MNWAEDSVQELKDWYVENDVTSDTLITNQDQLNEFTRKFNEKIGTSICTEEEVAEKLVRLRKSGKLPRIRD